MPVAHPPVGAPGRPCPFERLRLLSDVREHRVGDLTIRIDRHLCVGFGDCVERAYRAFELDEEQIAVLRDGAEATSREDLIAACEVCPVDALTVLDADGRQIVP